MLQVKASNMNLVAAFFLLSHFDLSLVCCCESVKTADCLPIAHIA